jgi:outer membrane lipoprotein carrier protein
MQKREFNSGLLLTLCLATLLSWAEPPRTEPFDLHRFAAAVDAHYNSLSTLETEFQESYRGAGMARTESGTMWLKKPGKMRWEYKSPRQKLFVTDGKQAWFYVPGERQARRMALKNLDDLRSPLRYLLGRSKLEKEFAALSLAPDQKPTVANGIVLRGIPKSMEDRVSSVLLEISPEYRISRVLIEELDGSTTEFRFSGQKENVAVTDARFSFTPPPGVEVMQATELQP